MIFESTNDIPSNIKFQITIADSLEPFFNYSEYISRVVNNQLIKYFDISENNPYTRFY